VLLDPATRNGRGDAGEHACRAAYKASCAGERRFLRVGKKILPDRTPPPVRCRIRDWCRSGGGDQSNALGAPEPQANALSGHHEPL
jgi:hypothetical protein